MLIQIINCKISIRTYYTFSVSSEKLASRLDLYVIVNAYKKSLCAK